MEMKRTIYYLSVFFFVSVVLVAGIMSSNGMTEATRLNGEGCVCHNPSADPNVTVRIWGPAQVTTGSTNSYFVSIKGGPAVKAGFNTAARFGSLDVNDASVLKVGNELTQSTPRVFGGADSVYWTFSYTAPQTTGFDTLYATGNSVNGDGIPTALDKWNFSPNFAVQVMQVVPVELTSFTARVVGRDVVLEWATATETNNSHFVVERKEGNVWTAIGKIDGKGTTTQKQGYTFSDNNTKPGKSSYRLKQVDFSGAFEYSSTVEAEVSLPGGFELSRNFPNPFNPVTVIRYTLPVDGNVTLTVYNSTGEVVKTLVNGVQTAGSHQIEFSAAELPSGIYFYRLEAGGVSLTRKMILSK